MVNSRKFVAETKDVSLTVRRADSFSISYVNCEKDVFGIDENQDGIKLVQTEKVSAFYWLHWLAKGSPEVIVSLPESVDFCEIEAESNQVLVTDIKADKIYAEVHNGRVEARNVQANDVFLKCLNGSAVANNVKVVASCMVDTLNGMSVLEGEITKGACLEVVCENGISEVSDKHKADLGYKTDGCAHYAVHCLNGKAVVK
ncbi:DUF4097 family beta strand repeat-containing protein [Gardnerella greenwoodii]|uniref:Adhesin domain-containing protein n=1 Tax=Gardnerella greenwoodii TaxID=2914925 RepID=A0A2N6RYD9_9BIFI|nr:DUF4097 family beta strand repeat-containing protein [Gardnerella greenwoodii]MDF0753365.1 DUF4097 family beta strand repeat-containing protein [Gardnerella greenwoodii]PMC43092.1 hypothetical protein CJ216_03100 [Gardnerella greenwoodii]